ncbi:MAG: hypothetical protein A2855_02470 [Candidatus Liptonbacteria bacterium RIFCSPHIGHO2_01_FULL_57_28]|uniref:Uncharacterized protein n=1 Tax=Candidatus Liptonbacteria bacterium RIFCSPHIGHO2_01_FULL_57_28 TaxID=1798647 RepID=A0A1G2C9V4_9BACT|nr:MAG: hypothetical protein A2855_02470 [Candidatus Liptonbacteria bacterium RIFCSPHIGHO2_01_FULL_57_28]
MSVAALFALGWLIRLPAKWQERRQSKALLAMTGIGTGPHMPDPRLVDELVEALSPLIDPEDDA